MDRQERIRISRDLDRWVDEQVAAVKIPSDDRTAIAAACLDLVFEHHKAIVLLMMEGLYGSAFAMVRLVFESYIRGLWLRRCASQAELSAFRQEKLGLPMNRLIEDIEKIDCFNVGVLSETKNSWWSPMCSFTHGGFAQVARRVGVSTIEPNYSSEESQEALRFCDAVSLLSLGEVAEIADDHKLRDLVLRRFPKSN